MTDKKYEIAYIFPSDEELMEQTRDAVRAGLEELKVKIEDENDIGMRDFTYPIRKQNSGRYYVFTVQMPPAVAHTLDGYYRHNNAVLRHLVLRLED